MSKCRKCFILCIFCTYICHFWSTCTYAKVHSLCAMLCDSAALLMTSSECVCEWMTGGCLGVRRQRSEPQRRVWSVCVCGLLIWHLVSVCEWMTGGCLNVRRQRLEPRRRVWSVCVWSVDMTSSEYVRWWMTGGCLGVRRQRSEPRQPHQSVTRCVALWTRVQSAALSPAEANQTEPSWRNSAALALRRWTMTQKRWGIDVTAAPLQWTQHTQWQCVLEKFH